NGREPRGDEAHDSQSVSHPPSRRVEFIPTLGFRLWALGVRLWICEQECRSDVRNSRDVLKPKVESLKPALVDGVRFVQLERRDFDVEMIAVFGDHLVGAAHQSGGRLERAA